MPSAKYGQANRMIGHGRTGRHGGHRGYRGDGRGPPEGTGRSRGAGSTDEKLLAKVRDLGARMERFLADKR